MSKEPSRLKNTKKGLHKTRRSVSSVHVPVTSAVDGSSSRMVIGTTSSSDPAPSTAASSVTAANHGTDAGSPVDKPLATEAGVVPSVPVPAGERSKRPEFSDAMPAGSPADVVPLSNAPDVVAVPVAAQKYVVNSVELAIAAATPPAYNRNGTKAMLYGGLLFLMATPLVRAIDAEGLKWTSNGTVLNSILTDSTYGKFQAKATCNNGMENGSVFPEIPALDITYSALKNSYLLEEREPLPLREDLLAEKVFFMTLCYVTCANPSGHYHFAGYCNMLVQNSKSFAHVFNCPKGSRMNPDEKCSFFT
ncbi:hypothetical protein V5799_026696 [Amblyomma americanum]|uniref:Peptidase M13 C-terminal domain-containing protein n=1 Tax=Amblyomma americanum TaxID=6943 RepID=A0AAQ4DHU6_AMBAM